MLQRDRQRQRERGTFSGGGAGAFTAEYLVVAGGGGGGSRFAGGGGAGGYLTAADFSIALGSPYAVTVGAGGAGGPASGGAGTSGAGFGANGANSVFSAFASIGGGGGGAGDSGNGLSGGSGGGGAGRFSTTGGAGTSGQGFAGGSGVTGGLLPYRGAGGGGAGEAGANNEVSGSIDGSGGDGLFSVITGTNVYRAGGGGGGGSLDGLQSGGLGGLGGGGNGGDYDNSPLPTAGTVNTGSGGGGGAYATSGTNQAGAAGGSGVVIIRVPSEVVAEFSAGVVYNYIPLDDFNVYEITAAGVSDTVTFSQGAVTTVGESLLFNDNDSAYLSRTPASAGDRKTWTWSGWVKRANIGTDQALFSCYFANNNADTFHLSFFNDNTLRVGLYSGYAMVTSQLFRDPSAWYHIVFALDTTAATASERWKLYVNGKQVNNFSTESYPALNDSWAINAAQAHYHSYLNGLGWYADGYMSDVHFIDGEALDPSRFGKQDADGVWQPITYTGTYGTNGFHLDFADNSTAAALGTDVSGNGNNWTPSGITTDDQVTDTPTVNYATLNPVDKDNNATLSDGNLKVSSNGAGNSPVTFFLVSGKWYWEAEGTGYATGVASEDGKNYAGSISTTGSKSIGHWSGDGNIYWDGGSAAGATYTASDVMAVALDMDGGTVAFYKNNTLIYTATFGSGTVPDLSAGVFPIHNNGDANSRNVTYNFGQRPFTYTPPAGFQALNSANLPAPVIADGKEHFQPALYTGNGTTQAIGGLEFQPDFVWIKNRSAADNHKLLDAVRGATLELESNTTDAEVTNSDGLTAFNSNGFTVGADLEYNTSGENFVAWNWNAGGSTVTNTDGTITSQVRANTDAGFSIVSWTGGGVAGTAGHGLTQAPEIYIYKNRSISANWAVAFTIIDGSLDFMYLNTTNAAGNAVQGLPTSSVISLNAGAGDVNSGQNYIAYCFAGVDGFSKFGSYTGNGSADGPFVYTGFRPAFVMIKCTSASGTGFDWIMHDTKRSVYNLSDTQLIANSSVEENKDSGGSSTVGAGWDILSNGFKLRTSSAGRNASGGTYIYMAFAENPFKTARAR